MEANHMSKNKKERYIPSLNTNTIVLKIAYIKDDIKIFIRFINGNVINSKIINYKTLSNSIILDKVIEVVETHTKNKPTEIIDSYGLSILRTYLEDDWDINSKEDKDIVYYGTKSEPKYVIKFYDIHTIPEELNDVIPFKMYKNIFMVYDVKNRINTLIHTIKKYLPNSVIIIDGECNLIILENASMGRIMKKRKLYRDPSLIEYKKIRIIREGTGMLTIENTFLTSDEAKEVMTNEKSNDYYTSKNIVRNHITHTRYKKVIIRDINTDAIRKIIDMEYTLYKRDNRDVRDIIKKVEEYMKNYISSVHGVKL